MFHTQDRQAPENEFLKVLESLFGLGKREELVSPLVLQSSGLRIAAKTLIGMRKKLIHLRAANHPNTIYYNDTLITKKYGSFLPERRREYIPSKSSEEQLGNVVNI